MNTNPGKRRNRTSLRNQPAAKRRRTNSGPGGPKRIRPTKPSIIREKIGNESRKMKRRRVESPDLPSQQQTVRIPGGGRGQKRGRNSSTLNSNGVVPQQERPGKRMRNVPLVIPNNPISSQQRQDLPRARPQKRSRNSSNQQPGPSRPVGQRKSQESMQPNKLFPHQRHVQGMVRDVIEGTKTPILRGGLVWHGTGTGKTVSSLSILVEYIRRGMTDRPYIVVVSHRSNIKENGREKYQRNLREHFPSVSPTALDPVHFLSYAQLANRLGLMRYREKWPDWKRRGLVIIIDESHVLTGAEKPRVVKQNDATATWKIRVWLETVFRRSTTQTSNAPQHIYCLTATPGASVKDFLRTINIIRPVTMTPLTQETVFVNPVVKRMVSYADIRNNYNIFPRPVAPNIQDVSVQLSFLHYIVICYSIGKMLFARGDMKDHDSCGETYLKKARSLEDIMYTSGIYSVLKGPVFETLCREYKTDTTGSVSIAPSVNTKSNRIVSDCDQPKLPIISPKIQQCIKNVTTKKGKHLLYIASHTHIPVIEAVLRQQYGFTDASSSARRKQSLRAPGKRFLAITKNTEQAKFADYFNSPGGDNSQGDIIKILIVSGQNYMGLNVRGLRGIHATSPFVTHSGHTQFQGRGARAYGHSNLPRDDRTTSAYMYESSVRSHRNTGEFDSIVSSYIESIGGKKMTDATLGHVKRGYEWLVKSFRQAVAHKRNLNVPMPRHYPLPSDIVRIVQVSKSQQNYAKFKERVIQFITSGSSS